MEPPPVIIAFDILKDDLLNRGAGQPVQALVKQLCFEAAPKGFHCGVIVAVSLAAHACDEPVRGQDASVFPAGVLAGISPE